MNALFNETGSANIDSQNYGALTVSVSNIKSYIDGTLGIDVAGKNTIKNKAEIIADSNAQSNIGLETTSGGAITVGTSELYSNTIAFAGHIAAQAVHPEHSLSCI